MTDYTGACAFWDSKPFMDAANILAASDEPLRAIDLLNNLPGFYRDHIPHEIQELKTKIYQDLATPIFYQKELPSPNYSNPDILLMMQVLDEFAGHKDVGLAFRWEHASQVWSRRVLGGVTQANTRVPEACSLMLHADG